MREIGGYFGLESLISKEYYSDLVALNSGRNALVYLLRAKKIKKIYIPYFLCDSIEKVCERERCDYAFYHISNDFYPIFEEELKANEYIYIVNYYGQISNKALVALKEKYKRIIFDNSHAFFQRPIEGVDTIYSCRKFLGVPDGAYLSTDTVIKGDLDIDTSALRMNHLLGRLEGNASDYYEVFKRNEEKFEELDLCYMSKLTHNIMGAIDYNNVRQKREHNYKILKEKLDAINVKVLSVHGVPYCYPFYCNNGKDIRKQLIERKIYIPTLWPNVLQMKDTLEKDLAENCLPIPCDQRYEEEDMLYIVQAINECLNK